MIGCLRGCLAIVVLLVAGAVVAWYSGPELMERVESWRGTEAEVAPEPSAELGATAMERARALVDGEMAEARFTGAELESVLRFELADRLPAGVSDPSVNVDGGELRVGVSVERDRIPRLPEIEQLRELLPDTVQLRLQGRVIGIDRGDAGFVVRRIDAAGIPVPDRFLPAVVEFLNPGAASDLPPEIVRVPLPDGIGAVRIEGDELVLSSGA